MSASMSLFEAPARLEQTAGALRPYQVIAVDKITDELSRNRSTLLTMATGTGKTRVFGEMALRHQGRVLVLAHRWELVKQARHRISEITGETIGTERAGWRSEGERIVCASKDSLHPDRLKAFKSDDFSLVIVDEAHHAPAKTYRAILDHFGDAKVLGVTATPDRADEKALGTVFDSVAYVYEMLDGINDGYLCPIVGETANVGMDLSGLRANGVGGDLGDGQLGGVVGRDDVMHSICAETMRLAGDRSTILFFPTVETAHVAAATLSAMRHDCAMAVDGTTEEVLRARTLRDHQRGQYQFLANCGVLTEGYDSPGIACVAIARPTKSRALYAQMVGRGTRIAPGKADCLILDFVGNAGAHALIGPTDILGGKYDDDVLELAAKKQREQGGDAAKHLKSASAEVEAQRKKAAARVLAQPKVRSHWSKFDPFGVLGVKNPANDPWAERYATPASVAQVEALKRNGIPVVTDISKAQASKLLGAMAMRRDKGLATVKQVQLLSRYGISAQSMYFNTASQVIDAVAKNNWHAPGKETIDAIVKQGGRR